MTDTFETVHNDIRDRYAHVIPTVTADELAEMRRQYQHATVAIHMLVDGVVRHRCLVCKSRPLPEDWSFMAWCDECLAELKRRTE